MLDPEHVPYLMDHHLDPSELKDIFKRAIHLGNIRVREGRVISREGEDPGPFLEIPKPEDEVPVLSVIQIVVKYTDHAVSVLWEPFLDLGQNLRSIVLLTSCLSSRLDPESCYIFVLKDFYI